MYVQYLFKRTISQVIHLEALYITNAYFSGATLRISYLLCLEANIAGDHIQPTFDKLTDAHPSLPTRALRIY